MMRLVTILDILQIRNVVWLLWEGGGGSAGGGGVYPLVGGTPLHHGARLHALLLLDARQHGPGVTLARLAQPVLACPTGYRGQSLHTW